MHKKKTPSKCFAWKYMNERSTIKLSYSCFTVLGYGQSRRRLQAASSYGMHDTYVMFI